MATGNERFVRRSAGSGPYAGALPALVRWNRSAVKDVLSAAGFTYDFARQAVAENGAGQ